MLSELFLKTRFDEPMSYLKHQSRNFHHGRAEVENMHVHRVHDGDAVLHGDQVLIYVHAEEVVEPPVLGPDFALLWRMRGDMIREQFFART